MNKPFKELDLNNAFLFAAAMEDSEICQIVLEIILGTKIPKVNVHSEHNIMISSDFRSVRLDVYANDEMQVSYNVEAQNQNNCNLAKRSRYHQAEMDVASLKPGEDFNDLKPGYVIFICTFDPFGEGLYRYTFEERCLERNIPLGDQTKKIFLSTKGRNKAEVPLELVNFLGYMENSTSQYVLEKGDEAIDRLHDKVTQLKQRRELEARFMTGEEYIKMEAERRAVGMAQEMASDMTTQTILEILSEYGKIPEELRMRLTGETKQDTLKAWLKLAAKVSSIEEFAHKM